MHYIKCISTHHLQTQLQNKPLLSETKHIYVIAFKRHKT